MLDGIDNSAEVGDMINRSYYVLIPPPDALEEFTVQTNNYSAEFGHSAGTVLNAIVKSGTNGVRVPSRARDAGGSAAARARSALVASADP